MTQVQVLAIRLSFAPASAGAAYTHDAFFSLEPETRVAGLTQGLGTGVADPFASPGTRSLIAAGGALSLPAFAV